MNSVCKDLYSALCCETKWVNLSNSILDFGVHFYGCSELSKCLLRMWKMQKIEPDPNLWRTKVSEAVCKRDWRNVRSYLFFLTCDNFRLNCAMTFALKHIEHPVWCLLSVFSRWRCLWTMRRSWLFTVCSSTTANWRIARRTANSSTCSTCWSSTRWV